ncbi:hypothetical protein ACLMJK_006118 [Lecanora helva]
MHNRKFQPMLPWDNDTLLLSALDASEQPTFCYTVRELTMLAWINELTDMPDWQCKIFDPDIAFRWKSEKVLVGQDVTRSMADWCIDEVRYYVADFNHTRIIPAIDGGVIKSDDCIGASLISDLTKIVSALRRSPTRRASSQGHIVDLVDPHLFPLAFGKTRTLRGPPYISPKECISRAGEGEVVRMPREEETKQEERGKYPNDMAWSRRFQWLPFEVIWEDRGHGAARIASYINDVHPITHSSLYRVIESLIDSLIPLFNRTLIDLKAPGYQNQRIHLADITRNPVVDRDPGHFRPPEQRAYRKWVNNQGQYDNSIFVDLKREFWNVGLQMVLQMRDINLSVDDPEYEGEDWHVQGQNNERIVATATYVYSISNIATTSSPKLSFRRRVHPEESVLARDSADWKSPPFLSDIYGAQDGSPSIQHLGDVTLREGRVVTFPNVFQTRLAPFTLQDKAKPGHLRLLMLHLIDPNRRAMSTSMVPCQRRDWWAHEIRTSCRWLWRLPKVVFNMIVEQVEDWPIPMEQGEKMRSEFLQERDGFRERHTRAMEGYQQWDFGEDKGDSDEEDEENDDDWDLCKTPISEMEGFSANGAYAN